MKSGFDLFHSTLIIGLQRLVPVFVNGVFGHYTDFLSPKKTVVTCEVVAAFCSLLLLAIWRDGETPYLAFLFLCVIRAVVVSFQTGSRSKLLKSLSDHTYSSNSRNAILFNKATQGATLFSGIIAWMIVEYSTFQFSIVFDAATFLLSGLAVFSIPNFKQNDSTIVPPDWKEKFSNYFKYNLRASRLDLILALCMMGTVAFMARIAAEQKQWIGIFMASYGAAVWVAGFLERKTTLKFPSYPFWFLLGICYLILGLYGEANIFTLIVFFIKDLSYWILLHRISSYIQIDSPSEKFGGISAARMALMASILSVGEILVGAWSSIVPIYFEATFRFLICSGVFYYLLNRKSCETHNERPIL